MDAVVMAGGVPVEGEALYPLTRGLSKALLPIRGKPMAQWVLDALATSRHVRRVVVVGLDGGLDFPREISYRRGGGDLLDNILVGARALLELDPGADRLLLVASDIPAVTGSHVDWVIERALEGDDELDYCVLERGAMEAVFPGCRRTYFRFRDRQVCGGDLSVVASSLFGRGGGAWHRLAEVRKSRVRIAATVGWDVLLLFLLRRLTVDEAARMAGRRLGVRARVLSCPFPEVGMDVDKPFQLEIVRAHLDRRLSG
jgi:CTP:molybdopterin cytidylyltransferase MocA